MRQEAGGARRAALGSPYGGRAHHIPNFPEPHPAGAEEALGDELHRVATAPAGRIGSEADVDVVRSGSGSGKAAMPDAPPPRPLPADGSRPDRRRTPRGSRSATHQALRSMR